MCTAPLAHWSRQYDPISHSTGDASYGNALSSADSCRRFLTRIMEEVDAAAGAADPCRRMQTLTN